MSRTYERLFYFLKGAGLEYFPDMAAIRRLQRLLPETLDQVPADILDRVAYCNQLGEVSQTCPEQCLGEMSHKHKPFYYFDLLAEAKGFGKEFRLNPLFGDITYVPDVPSIVKSRPINGNVANSVLMKLDRFRHFYFPKDTRSWEDKRPSSVWRGRIHSQAPRQAVVERYHNSDVHDIGHVEQLPGLPDPKGWLSISQQLEHRYILSIEGNDVATNLKWAMASNSVVLSPALEFETWFMEGKLIPGEHFVELRPDMADLDDKIAWLEENQKEAQQIIANAHAWVRQFHDKDKEQLVAALVLQKYAEMTGGLEFTHSKVRLFT